MALLDPLMAGFAASAVAFAVFALPDWRFEQAVELSGLPALLSAAQPPLGSTARLGTMLAAAIGTFAFVLLLLRALARPAPKPRAFAAADLEEMPLPKLRRADAHPDAPARRPIRAGLDLGAPLDDPVAEEAEPDVEAAEEFAEEPPTAIEPARQAEEAPQHVEALDLTPRHEETLQALVARIPEAGDGEAASISNLMERLERGLVRRERGRWPAPAQAVSAPAAPAKIDDRLRSAIEDLQKLTTR